MIIRGLPKQIMQISGVTTSHQMKARKGKDRNSDLRPRGCYSLETISNGKPEQGFKNGGKQKTAATAYFGTDKP